MQSIYGVSNINNRNDLVLLRTKDIYDVACRSNLHYVNENSIKWVQQFHGFPCNVFVITIVKNITDQYAEWSEEKRAKPVLITVLKHCA